MSKISRRLDTKSKRLAKRYFGKVYPELVVKFGRCRRVCLTQSELALAMADAIARGEVGALSLVCRMFEKKTGKKLKVVRNHPRSEFNVGPQFNVVPKRKKNVAIQHKTLSNAELNSGWKQGYQNTSNWP